MGQENLDPAWSFGPEGGERFEVEVQRRSAGVRGELHEGLQPGVD